MREAHRTDVANELKELEERDREEAERQRELAARKTAAALFRITPTEGMLVLSSDNFIRELLRLAPADLHGSELYAAAQRAVLNPSPDAWKAFIHTGADAAYKLDDENRRKKAAEADRRLALQIQAAAENGGMHPNLVAAAKKALAGTDAQVAAFLKEDTQYRLKRQSIQSLDVDATGWNIRQSAADKGEAFITPVDSRSPLADREDATWTVVPSLAGRPGCWSFESARKPGYYLMATLPSLRLKIAADDRTSAFRTNATWCNRKNGSATGFVWGVKPGGALDGAQDGIHVFGHIERVAVDREERGLEDRAAPRALNRTRPDHRTKKIGHHHGTDRPDRPRRSRRPRRPRRRRDHRPRGTEHDLLPLRGRAQRQVPHRRRMEASPTAPRPCSRPARAATTSCSP